MAWRVAVACLLVVACSGQARHDAPRKKQPTRPVRVVLGNFRAASDCAEAAVDLVLKTGVTVEVCRAAQAQGAVSLAIAPERVPGRALAPGFVPLGPTFVVTAPDTQVACGYGAERYEVRRGFRPVLARLGVGVGTFEPATYADARFAARAELIAGARFQFGLLPEADVIIRERDAQVLHNAAP